MYDKILKEHKERQNELTTEVKMHDYADENCYLTVNKVLSLAQRAHEIFERSEVSEKRQLLNFLLQNIELKGEDLAYKLKTPWDTVLLASQNSRWLARWDGFRTAHWMEFLECPELIANQAHHLLALT